MTSINQKEYLKKYLGLGKKSGDKKKKKKTKKIAGNGLKIVDDDIDVNLNEEIKVDLTADNEDAPQIVSIIDDRPPSLRIDEKTKDHLWQPIGAPDIISSSNTNLKFEGSIKLSKNVDGGKSLLKRSESIKPSKNNDYSPPKKSRRKNSPDSDNSPPRYKKTSSDASPERKDEHSRNSVSDASPSRSHHKKGNNMDNSPRERETRDSSPPRRHRREKSEDKSLPRRRNHDDFLPPIQIKREKSLDTSPPRKRTEDMSPLRRKNEDSSPPRKIKSEKTPDISPPRRRRKENSPPTKIPDNSPPRRNRKDSSPPRRAKLGNDSSPPRRIKSEKNDDSPPRRNKKSRWADNEAEDGKLKKTLDGKTAGLQNAANLVLETQALKKREDELFKNMSADVSGAHAATIVRSKKKKEVDWEEEERKRKREEKNKEQYNKWGKGLKQVEDINEKIKSDLHEMSKPLARYADDQDLEKYLKDQERDGDPMLAYIRQKKRKKHVEEGKPVTQEYQGDAPPNRFGIRPGYRWDGVDRSSGYEKQWFQLQNSRQASVEETYKWSTEDM